MFKFIYFTDSHLRLLPSANRKEGKQEFVEKILEKIKKVLKIANNKNVNAIICGGDFFDAPNPSHTLISKVIKIFSNNTIPFYIVPGNHDIFSGNINTLYRTGIQILFESGYVNQLKELNKNNVYIKGKHFSYNNVDFRIKRKKKNNILIPHYMITEKKAPFESFLPSEIKTDADLVLCSHYHKPFDINENRTRFVNPGSLLRLSSIKMNHERYPEVLLVNCDDEIKINKIHFEEFGIGNEIFNKVTKKSTESNFDKFVEYVSDFNNKEDVNIRTAIKEVKKTHKVSEEVVNKTKEFLSI